MCAQVLDPMWLAIQGVLSALANPLIASGVVVGAVSLSFAGRYAARRFGWQPVPSVLTGLFLGVVLGVTFSRTVPGWATAAGQPFCNISGFSLNGMNELLNALLFVPLVICAVLATRRPLAVLISAVALSAFIEVVQPLTNRGICETQDFLNNTAGAVAAAGIGAALLVLQRSGVKASR